MGSRSRRNGTHHCLADAHLDRSRSPHTIPTARTTEIYPLCKVQRPAHILGNRGGHNISDSRRSVQMSPSTIARRDIRVGKRQRESSAHCQSSTVVAIVSALRWELGNPAITAVPLSPSLVSLVDDEAFAVDRHRSEVLESLPLSDRPSCGGCSRRCTTARRPCGRSSGSSHDSDTARPQVGLVFHIDDRVRDHDRVAVVDQSERGRWATHLVLRAAYDASVHGTIDHVVELIVADERVCFHWPGCHSRHRRRRTS